ncbi:MAG TPA: CHRD domain-containing protein [Nitrososphaeraceae archaeon]|nr:CHRD domain-containing protein [Nitrososphaeraceae archaeon]
MNFPSDKNKNQKEEEDEHGMKEENKKAEVDFAAILTGKEEVPEVNTWDTALATFQSTAINNNNRDDYEKDYDLKYSVKVTDTDKIKEVDIHTGKPNEKGDVVAELYKSETSSGEIIMNNLKEGKIKSEDLKGPLQGKNTKDLVRKIEKGEAYVDIKTEDKPEGKVRGKIKKIKPS